MLSHLHLMPIHLALRRAGADLGSGTRWSLGSAVDSDGVDRKREQDMLSSTFEKDFDLDEDEERLEDEDDEMRSKKPAGIDKAIARIIADNARLLRRCKAMLGQALSGSEHGDVRFEFEDGRTPLSGHRAVLSAVSEEYGGMFRSGMVEEKKGVVRVPPGISEAGYRGLLEWVYLGGAFSLSLFFHPHTLVHYVLFALFLMRWWRDCVREGCGIVGG